MIALPWDPLGYTFWYLLLAMAMSAAERIHPWRRQPILRPGICIDLFLVVFNGLLLGLVLNSLLSGVSRIADYLTVPHWRPPILVTLPLWAQFVLVLIIKDFAEWLVHNLLHRVGWLWQIHKVHHSITTMDWMGNMRFHWMEIIVYRSLLWLPLSLVVVDWHIALALGVFSTLIGHLNHSNLRIDWGPLRFLVNSPRFHIWHHDVQTQPQRPYGTNFAIIFSCWDWLFGTAYLPNDRELPVALGYAQQSSERVTPGGRWLWPFWRR